MNVKVLISIEEEWDGQTYDFSRVTTPVDDPDGYAVEISDEMLARWQRVTTEWELMQHEMAARIPEER